MEEEKELRREGGRQREKEKQREVRGKDGGREKERSNSRVMDAVKS